MCNGAICMCGSADLGIIPSPSAAARFLARHWRELAALAAIVAVVSFVITYAVIVGLAVAGFVVVMGGVLVLVRQPDWLTERRPVEQVPVLTLTARRVPAELDAPPARAIAGLRDHLAIEPAPVIGADLTQGGWAYRDPGLDHVTRQRADEIWAGHHASMPR